MSRSTRGFSMLEVLVVLVIVGILAVVTGNWYGASQPSAVKGTTTTIYALLNEARATARSTGRSVTLNSAGTGAGINLFFPAQGDIAAPPAVPGAGQALVSWTQAGAGTIPNKYSAVDVDGTLYTHTGPTPDPVAGNVPAIKALFTGSSLASTNRLFKGATSAVYFFDSTGRASQDFYVFIAGTRNGATYNSAPVGLVLVSRANGVHAFYKPNAASSSSQWQRL